MVSTKETKKRNTSPLGRKVKRRRFQMVILFFLLLLTPIFAEQTYHKPIGQLGKDAFRATATIEHLLLSNDGNRLQSFSWNGQMTEWNVKTRAHVDTDVPQIELPNMTGPGWVAHLFPTSELDVRIMIYSELPDEGRGAERAFFIARTDVKTGESTRVPNLRLSSKPTISGDRMGFVSVPGFWEVHELKSGGKTFKGDYLYQKADDPRLALSATGTYLISGSASDRSRGVIGWDVERQSRLWTLKDAAMAWISPNPIAEKALLASDSGDQTNERQTLALVDFATGKTIWSHELPSTSQDGVWSPDGSHVVILADPPLLINGATGTIIETLDCPTTPRCGVFSKDSARFYLGVDHVIHEYSVTGKRLYPTPSSSPLTKPFSRFIPIAKTNELVFESGNYVRSMDMTTGNLKPWKFPCLTSDIAISSDQTKIAVIGTDWNADKKGVNDGWIRFDDEPFSNVLWVLDSQTKKVLNTLSAPPGFSYSKIAFSADDSSLFFSYENDDGGVLGTLDLKTGKWVQRPHPEMVSDAFSFDALVPSNDGNYLVGIMEQRAVVWKLGLNEKPTNLTQDDHFYWHAVCIGTRSNVICLVGHDDGMRCLTFWRIPSLPKKVSLTDDVLRKHLRDLGGASYKVRRNATNTLIAAGPSIVPSLARLDSSDPEIKERIKTITKVLNDMLSPEFLTTLHYKRTFFAIANQCVKEECLIMAYNDKGETIIEMCHYKKDSFLVVKRFKCGRYHTDVETDSDGRIYAPNANGTITIYDAKEERP